MEPGDLSKILVDGADDRTFDSAIKVLKASMSNSDGIVSFISSCDFSSPFVYQKVAKGIQMSGFGDVITVTLVLRIEEFSKVLRT
jgi:hypothetical protein